EILRKKSGWMNFNSDGKDYIIVFNSVGSIGWMVTDIIPYNEIMSDFNKVRTKIITFSIIVSLLVIALYLLISSSIVRPLNAVTKSFRRMQKGDLSVTAEGSMLAEVDELSEDFNKMVKTINNLLEEIKVANIKERDAELKALQVQINPHFLYNTLDIIYWMTDSKEIASITNNLARFFRLSLSSGKNIISVEEELEQVKVYLNIQNIRFKNKFVYIENVDPEVLGYPMLKLILQPLVENALLHGLKYVKDGGIIKLHGKIDNGDLEFKVEDNGTGVDLERINYILEGHEAHNGYGIKNVNERIKLKYGNQYGLFYSNKEEGGTCVKMIIPAIDNSENGNA
ncbi:MAG TPA: sensor histidine kinase, partial [Anaerovoracaceae bacterium]|nr:sensor histidine kinase [Anaerovoracaceae bacterium]